MDPSTVSLQEYVRSFDLAYQQRESKLYRTVRTTTQASKSKYYQFIGAVEMEEIATRHGDTPLEDPEHTRRRLQITGADKGLPLDEEDEISMVADPGGQYMAALQAGVGRRTDRKIIKALGGPAYSGEEGATTVNNYDTGECRLIDGDGALVTAGSDHSGTTDTNLTVDKILTCKKLLGNAHVPEEGRFFLLNEQNINQLLKDTTYGSEEYRTVRDIKDGKVSKFLTFEFVILADDMFVVSAADATCIECYAYHRDAVICATGEGKFSTTLRVDTRTDKRMMRQFYAKQFCGATRLKGPGVIEILLKTL